MRSKLAARFVTCNYNYENGSNKCYFPSQWKDGNVTPIYKKDEKSLPSNYRPITLLSLVGKTMERCVQKRLYNYTIAHCLITPLESGFIQGDSTTCQLLHTYHTFCEAVDSGKEIRVVFCDVSKAFDRVWHRGLLHTLRATGCSEKVTQWFASGVFPFRLLPFCILPFCLLPFRLLPFCLLSNFKSFPFRLHLIFLPCTTCF